MYVYIVFQPPQDISYVHVCIYFLVSIYILIWLMSRVIFFYFSASQFNVFINFSRSPLLDTFLSPFLFKNLCSFWNYMYLKLITKDCFLMELWFLQHQTHNIYTLTVVISPIIHLPPPPSQSLLPVTLHVIKADRSWYTYRFEFFPLFHMSEG